jgi:hypothetical protein
MIIFKKKCSDVAELLKKITHVFFKVTFMNKGSLWQHL